MIKIEIEKKIISTLRRINFWENVVTDSPRSRKKVEIHLKWENDRLTELRKKLGQSA